MIRQQSRLVAGSVLLLSLIFSSALRATPMLDIVVLMDSSSSITNEDHEEQKDVVSYLMGLFTIGPADTQFSLIQFATTAQTLSNLSGSASALDTALSNGNQMFGQTNHGDAFAEAASELANNGRGGPVQDVVILMTDGQANEPVSGPVDPVLLAYLEAENLKNSGALLFSVGFGNAIDQADLGDYASNPSEDYTIFVDGFSDGYEAMDDIYSILNLTTSLPADVDEPAPLALLMFGLLVLLFRRDAIRPKP